MHLLTKSPTVDQRLEAQLGPINLKMEDLSKVLPFIIPKTMAVSMVQVLLILTKMRAAGAPQLSP